MDNIHISSKHSRYFTAKLTYQYQIKQHLLKEKKATNIRRFLVLDLFVHSIHALHNRRCLLSTDENEITNNYRRDNLPR